MKVTIWHENEPPKERELYRVFQNVDRTAHYRNPDSISLYSKTNLIASFGGPGCWSIETGPDDDPAGVGGSTGPVDREAL
jgi:hypothetical protein